MSCVIHTCTRVCYIHTYIHTYTSYTCTCHVCMYVCNCTVLKGMDEWRHETPSVLHLCKNVCMYTYRYPVHDCTYTCTCIVHCTFNLYCMRCTRILHCNILYIFYSFFILECIEGTKYTTTVVFFFQSKFLSIAGVLLARRKVLLLLALPTAMFVSSSSSINESIIINLFPGDLFFLFGWFLLVLPP